PSTNPGAVVSKRIMLSGTSVSLIALPHADDFGLARCELRAGGSVRVAPVVAGHLHHRDDRRALDLDLAVGHRALDLVHVGIRDHALQRAGFVAHAPADLGLLGAGLLVEDL